MISMKIKKNIHPRIKLSTLWIVVLINMIFANIFSIMIELAKGNTLNLNGNVNTGMTIAALLTSIPILMIYFSWILPYKSNRIANTIAGVLTIVYIIGWGALTPHYIILAGIEIFVLVLIMIIAWKWPDPEMA